MSPTQTQDTAQFSPEQIYNLIMEQIEPDLTTDMLEILDDLYEGEPDEERAEREARYQEAFAEFETQYKVFVDGWQGHYFALRKKAMKLNRDKNEKAASVDTSTIEDSLQNS